jgi:hypothetical protein
MGITVISSRSAVHRFVHRFVHCAAIGADSAVGDPFALCTERMVRTSGITRPKPKRDGSLFHTLIAVRPTTLVFLGLFCMFINSAQVLRKSGLRDESSVYGITVPSHRIIIALSSPAACWALSRSTQVRTRRRGPLYPRGVQRGPSSS